MLHFQNISTLTNSQTDNDLEDNKQREYFGEGRHQAEDTDDESWNENGWLSSKLVSERTNDYGTNKETKENSG